MDTLAIEKYTNTIGGFTPASELPNSLRISDGPNGLSTYYAPFDYINLNAKVVICGITPGLSQANAALKAMIEARKLGESLAESLRIAKATASFAGVMRNNIAAMLDNIEVNKLLKISTCSSLFGGESDLVHYTSALRYPVFKNGKNYSGGKEMIKLPYLWDQSSVYLREEIDALRNAIWLPLGQSVVEVFERFVAQGQISENQVLFGLPHASGANAERIKYFLGQKPRENLSVKVNPYILDSRKALLKEKVASLSHSSD